MTHHKKQTGMEKFAYSFAGTPPLLLAPKNANGSPPAAPGLNGGLVGPLSFPAAPVLFNCPISFLPCLDNLGTAVAAASPAAFFGGISRATAAVTAAA